MTGLEKILQTISQDADERAQKLIYADREKADKLKSQIINDAELESEVIISQAKEKAREITASAESEARLNSSKQILSLKDELTVYATARSVEKIVSLPTEEYFSHMKKMIVSYLRSGRCVLTFNERDTKRIPENFLDDLSLSRPDCIVEISNTPSDIMGGFILSFGDVRENCSLDAIIEERREEIAGVG